MLGAETPSPAALAPGARARVPVPHDILMPDTRLTKRASPEDFNKDHTAWSQKLVFLTIKHIYQTSSSCVSLTSHSQGVNLPCGTQARKPQAVLKSPDNQGSKHRDTVILPALSMAALLLSRTQSASTEVPENNF